MRILAVTAALVLAGCLVPGPTTPDDAAPADPLSVYAALPPLPEHDGYLGYVGLTLSEAALAKLPSPDDKQARYEWELDLRTHGGPGLDLIPALLLWHADAPGEQWSLMLTSTASEGDWCITEWDLEGRQSTMCTSKSRQGECPSAVAPETGPDEAIAALEAALGPLDEHAVVAIHGPGLHKEDLCLGADRFAWRAYALDLAQYPHGGAWGASDATGAYAVTPRDAQGLGWETLMDARVAVGGQLSEPSATGTWTVGVADLPQLRGRMQVTVDHPTGGFQPTYRLLGPGGELTPTDDGEWDVLRADAGLYELEVNLETATEPIELDIRVMVTD